MIIIPFIPGSFGTTIEYVIRNYSKEYADFRINDVILPTDGSMHCFKKMNHITTGQQLIKTLDNTQHELHLVTLVYPLVDMNIDDMCRIINYTSIKSLKLIPVIIDNYMFAEMNLLFWYHKIIKHKGLGDYIKKLITVDAWNQQYRDTNEMQIWEMREFLSMFYQDILHSWCSERMHNFNSVGIVTTKQILEDTANTFNKIIELCGLTVQGDLESFANLWRSNQQYILDEYTLINNIVNSVVSNSNISWRKLNIFAESTIQRKLRASGYDIRCYALNEFPLNSEELREKLYSI